MSTEAYILLTERIFSSSIPLSVKVSITSLSGTSVRWMKPIVLGMWGISSEYNIYSQDRGARSLQDRASSHTGGRHTEALPMNRSQHEAEEWKLCWGGQVVYCG